MNAIKKHLNNKRKQEISAAIKATKNGLTGNDHVESRLMLEKVISYMNSNSIYVTKPQCKQIISVNNSINHRSSNTKETIKRECDNMIKILNKTYVEPSKRETAMRELDEKIDEVYNKLTLNNNRIHELEKAQAAVLGKDKNLWKRYQSEINRRRAENRVFDQNYDTLLKKKENLGIVDEVEKSAAVNVVIEQDDMYIDYDASTELIKNNELHSQEVNAENEKLQDAIFASSSTNSLDDEYNKALEAAAMRNLETVSAKQSDSSDTKILELNK